MEYKEESLQALAAFFLKFNPVQGPSFGMPEKLLNRRMSDFYEEVGENLAERSGLSARIYVDHVHNALFGPGFYAYATLARLGTPLPGYFMGIDAGELLERFGIQSLTRRSVCREQHLSLEKENELWDAVDNARHWKVQMDLAISFAEDCYRNGKKALLLNKKPNGLSARLERDREEVFLESMKHSITGSVPQEINKARRLLRAIRLTALNLKSEIDQNFFTLISGITRPYLQFLLRNFRRQLKLTRKMPPTYCKFPPKFKKEHFFRENGWTELQELLQRIHALRLSALEEICGLLEERLEMQQLALEALEKKNPSKKSVDKDSLLMDCSLYLKFFGGEYTAENFESLGLDPDMSDKELEEKRMLMYASTGWTHENREVHPVTGKKWSRNVYGPYYSFFNAHTCDRLILASYYQPPVLPG